MRVSSSCAHFQMICSTFFDKLSGEIMRACVRVLPSRERVPLRTPSGNELGRHGETVNNIDTTTPPFPTPPTGPSVCKKTHVCGTL